MPTLLAYGLPALPLYMLLLAIGFFPYFYTLHLGYSFAVAGTLVLATRLWDVVTDPLIGLLSDGTRLRIGRRKPWLLAGLPPLALGIERVFFADATTTPLALGLWSMLLFLGWTMASLPLNAWSAELSEEYHERARISAVREGFALLGSFLALVLLVRAVDGGGAGIGDAFRTIGLILMLTLPPAILGAVLLVPDRPARPRGTAGALLDLEALRRNAPLRRLAGAFLVNGIANGLPPTLFLYYVGAVLGVPDEAAFLILLYFACGVLGIPFWTLLARRIGKHRSWMTAMAVAAVSFLPAAFFGEDQRHLFLPIVVLTGLCLGADFFLPPAIAADVADSDELLSGRARAGLFFSLLSMIYKASWAVAGAAGLFVLGLSGFEASVGTSNSSTALSALAFAYATLPALFKLGAIAILRGFTLDEQAHRATHERLALARNARQ